MKISDKNRFNLPTIMGISLALMASCPAYAQVASAPAVSRATAPTQAPARDIRANEVIGKQVKNAEGEELGKIHDLVIDVENEQVNYAVLSFGGVLGLGNKLFAFPVNVFALGRNQDELILNVDKGQLKKAPGFDADKWPDFARGTYRTQVDQLFFKEDVAKKTAKGGRLVRVADVIGKDVNDQSQQQMGKIEDVIVNFSKGSARYVVLSSDEIGNRDRKLFAVPFSALIFPTRPELSIMLHVQQEKLANAPAFEQNKWPDLNAPPYQQQVNSYLASFKKKANQPSINANPGETSSGPSR